MIELPYKGKQMSMYVIAPFDDNIKCTNHLFKTVIQLEDENFDNLLDSEVLTTLEMPKFKIEFELDSMKSLLNNIGLKSVFQPHSADLTGFNPNITNLYIDDIGRYLFEKRGQNLAQFHNGPANIKRRKNHENGQFSWFFLVCIIYKDLCKGKIFREIEFHKLFFSVEFFLPPDVNNISIPLANPFSP